MAEAAGDHQEAVLQAMAHQEAEEDPRGHQAVAHQGADHQGAGHQVVAAHQGLQEAPVDMGEDTIANQININKHFKE